MVYTYRIVKAMTKITGLLVLLHSFFITGISKRFVVKLDPSLKYCIRPLNTNLGRTYRRVNVLTKPVTFIP